MARVFSQGSLQRLVLGRWDDCDFKLEVWMRLEISLWLLIGVSGEFGENLWLFNCHGVVHGHHLTVS